MKKEVFKALQETAKKPNVLKKLEEQFGKENGFSSRTAVEFLIRGLLMGTESDATVPAYTGVYYQDVLDTFKAMNPDWKGKINLDADIHNEHAGEGEGHFDGSQYFVIERKFEEAADKEGTRKVVETANIQKEEGYTPLTNRAVDLEDERRAPAPWVSYVIRKVLKSAKKKGVDEYRFGIGNAIVEAQGFSRANDPMKSRIGPDLKPLSPSLTRTNGKKS